MIDTIRVALAALVAFIKVCLIAGSFGAGGYAAFFVLDVARDRYEAWTTRRAAINRVINQSRDLVRHR